MPDFIKPDMEELGFRKELLSDRRTMDFGTGTIAFDEDEWESWYGKWVEGDPKKNYYRLIYCEGCGYFVGETGYERAEDGSACVHILIDVDLRDSGYGSAALKHIASVAMENGMDTLSAKMDKHSPYFRFMKRRGFKAVSIGEDTVLMKADSLLVSQGKIFEIDETKCCCKKKKEAENA